MLTFPISHSHRFLLCQPADTDLFLIANLVSRYLFDYIPILVSIMRMCHLKIAFFKHDTYLFEEAPRGRYWYTKALKKLNKNWSISARRWGWCPQWVEGFRYGAGPAPSTLLYRWGRWEGEGFVDIGCLPLEWWALLGVEDGFNIFLQCVSNLTWRWFNQGSPPSSSRTADRIGNSLQWNCSFRISKLF